ncbi:FAD-dependent monooxygenase [Roseomonas elaeocarpi]|uniref:FAD-dependent monooxygenase n=1 Tax=Roseomonas elaeocarpi TaxID=907779 RepID=A0ABV6JWN4_9PROT
MQDVLIVGAGPTGLVLALWLTGQGVKVRIIGRSAGPGETSRAMAVQARTLELYRQLDLAEAVVAAGHPVPAINLWARGRHRARIAFRNAGSDLTAYPFVLTYPQDHHERLLIERLASVGVTVERRTELLSFEDEADHVTARLRMPDGTEQRCEARYLAGCDGARSTVRHQLGTGFDGGTYRQVFYVADAEAAPLGDPGEAHVALDRGDLLLVLPYGEGRQCRLIGTVQDERAEHAETLRFEDVSHESMASLGLGVEAVNWFSTYRVHHRVTDHFRQGRAFLLGDAAHVHSPAGGQGMNTGISDAINLAWKLAAAVKGRAPDSLLDSYEVERQGFARTLVDTTDRFFTFATAGGSVADFVRTRLFPSFASVAYEFGSVREFMFRVVSQTMLHYHDSPLSEGRAGTVKGGDRLPWVRSGGSDNHDPLPAIGWQVHLYGTARAELRRWCEQHRLPLRSIAWTPAHREAGFGQDAAYLLRPDSYVALADPEASPAALAQYCDVRGLVLG